jgi:hypothetical protein
VLGQSEPSTGAQGEDEQLLGVLRGAQIADVLKGQRGDRPSDPTFRHDELLAEVGIVGGRHPQLHEHDEDRPFEVTRERIAEDARATTSASGVRLPNAGQAAYGSAKAAIAALTLVAAEELERYGVRVNAIALIARTRLTLATPGMGAVFAAGAETDTGHDLFDVQHLPGGRLSGQLFMSDHRKGVCRSGRLDPGAERLEGRERGRDRWPLDDRRHLSAPERGRRVNTTAKRLTVEGSTLFDLALRTAVASAVTVPGRVWALREDPGREQELHAFYADQAQAQDPALAFSPPGERPTVEVLGAPRLPYRAPSWKRAWRFTPL